MKLKRFLSIIFVAVYCCTLCTGLCSCNEGNEGKDNNGVANTSNNPFYAVYKNVRIELDKKADDVIEKLGEAKYKDNLGDCGGIGVQMKYTYDDITVNTLKENDGEFIHKIAFITDVVSTPKGISIGSSESEVKAAYGSPTSSENGKMIYKSNDLELEFAVKDGTVSAVNYRRIR